MSFSWNDYRKLQSEIIKCDDLKQVILPYDEYAMVMSEINTHMSEEDRTKKLVVKPIGNYYYSFINKGFDDYIIIAKRPIINVAEDSWEGLK